MLFLLFGEIGMFLSGGGGFSPSGSHSFTLATGLAFPFGDLTYGYLEIETSRYFSLELFNYTPKKPTSEVSHQSSKLFLGPSVEFRFKKFLLNPGIYYDILLQKIEDKYIDGNYRIKKITSLQSKGFGVKFTLYYPINERYRIGISWKKECRTIPSYEFSLAFRAVFK